jgi:ribosomal protein L37AE/L43A
MENESLPFNSEHSQYHCPNCKKKARKEKLDRLEVFICDSSDCIYFGYIPMREMIDQIHRPKWSVE